MEQVENILGRICWMQSSVRYAIMASKLFEL
jgi:hypothetical protein